MQKIIKKIGLAIATFILLINSLYAQNPDLILTEAERDSILAEYDQIFPLWGKMAIEYGFDLPFPVGINVNYLYMDQGIDIGNLGLSSGSNTTQPVDFIKFSEGRSTLSTVNARFDLWVLPFINVYSFIGQGNAKTKVSLFEPIPFNSEVNQKGNYYGVGLNGSFGISEYWLSVDVNWSWSDLELLKDIVQGRVLGLRFGKTLPSVTNGESLSGWVQ